MMQVVSGKLLVVSETGGQKEDRGVKILRENGGDAGKGEK